MSLDNNYAFEIDFLPVGNGDSSGDAIALRWLEPSGFCVAVVDGGTKESGERLVEHVRTAYGATYINLAINTHPDQDHSSGLSVVLEKMPVEQLWMHRPWAYPAAIKHLFANSQFTTAGLAGRLKAALDSAYELEKIATKKGVTITEPYQGLSYGPLLVLSPPQPFYLQLIPHFRNTPEARQSPTTLLGALAQAATQRMGTIAESWGIETLREDGVTSAENESSVVLYGRFNGLGVLLTGDAGQRALTQAAVYAISRGISLPDCSLYQVPHHGSRRNVSPSVLDVLLGPRTALPRPMKRDAVASVGAACTTHPRKVVTNAFTRRGVEVAPTRGRILQFCTGYPIRAGYGPITYLPLYSNVEEYD